MEENQNSLLQAYTPFTFSTIIPQELKHHAINFTQTRRTKAKRGTFSYPPQKTF